jgi:hypothetical protein
MRKSMRLGAATALAAVAMVAGSATAASAGDKGHDDPKGVNVCGNGVEEGLAQAAYGSEVEAESVYQVGNKKVNNCQTGEENVFVYRDDSENEAEGGSSSLAELLGLGFILLPPPVITP